MFIAALMFRFERNWLKLLCVGLGEVFFFLVSMCPHRLCSLFAIALPWVLALSVLNFSACLFKLGIVKGRNHIEEENGNINFYLYWVYGSRHRMKRQW